MNNMNQITKILFFLFLSVWLFAQNSDHKNAISYKMLVTDYNTLDTQYRKENPKRYIHPDDVNFGAEIGYQRYIFSSLNAGATLRLGSVDSYHLLIDSTDGGCISAPCNRRFYRNELFTSFGIHADYKFNNGYLLKENFFIAPYLRVGLNAFYLTRREGNFDLQLPMALGVNIRLNPLFSLQTQFDYNQSFVVNKQNFVISAGFVWTLGKMVENKETETETEVIIAPKL
jgi:hypothetical protein